MFSKSDITYEGHIVLDLVAWFLLDLLLDIFIAFDLDANTPLEASEALL